MNTNKKIWRSPDFKYWWQLSIFVFSYTSGIIIVMEIEGVHGLASSVFPSAGIAQAFMILFGVKYWLAIPISGFLYLTQMTGYSVPFFFMGNMAATLQAVFAVQLLKYVKFDQRLNTLSDVLKLIFFGSLIATQISCTLGVLSLCFLNMKTWDDFFELRWNWWLGDTMGVLIFTPLILLYYPRLKNRQKKKSFNLYQFIQSNTQQLFLLSLIILVSWLVFATNMDKNLANYPLEYLPLPLIIWGALKFGQKFSVFATFLVSMISILLSSQGSGPFMAKTSNVDEAILLLQTFMAVMTITILLLSGTAHEWRKTEQFLRDSEIKYRELVENANSIILKMDIAGDITFFNNFAERFFGFSQTEIIGESVIGTIVPMQDTAGNDLDIMIKGIVTNPEKFAYNENENIRKTGEKVWIAWSNRPIFDEENNLTGVLCIGTDLTIQKQAECRLQRLNQDLEERVAQRTTELVTTNHQLEMAREKAELANQAKSSFIANMSHELRTPLNAILGFSQLMSRSHNLDSDQRENIKIINRSGEYLLGLINNVLAIAKIEAGKTTFNTRNFNLYQLLGDIEDLFHLKAENQGLQLNFEWSASELPQYINTDEMKLRQILINLLSNSLKFTENGAIAVTIEPVSQSPFTLRFSVADTGVGMAEEELNKLFQVFYQTRSGQESQEGTGLGLAISYKFVQLMGGNLTVESQLGLGTTFIFDIPVEIVDQIEETTTAPTSTVIGLVPGQRIYRILVVDDKEVNRLLLVKMLQPLGFQVKEAANGKEAIALWESWEPHLIWMDMRMPVMDGYEATKYIKSQVKGSATAIIALTASVLEEEKAIVLSAGCDDFIRKPFREATIFEEMSKHLGVQYIYADNANVSPVINTGKQSLTVDSFQDLSASWLAEVKAACIDLDDQLLLELLTQLPPEKADLAETLKNMIDNFEIDGILSIFAQNEKNKIS